MKKYILLISFTLISSPLLRAQTPPEDDFALKTFGVGIGFQQFENYWFNWAPASRLIFTFNIKNVYRVEPEIGFSTSKEVQTNYTRNNKDYLVGINNYFILKRNRVCLLPGLKFGYIKNKGFYEDPPDPSRETESNSYFIGPILGMEYYFSQHFSIGGDLGIIYLSEKYVKTWDGDDQEEKRTNSSAEIKFRFYF